MSLTRMKSYACKRASDEQTLKPPAVARARCFANAAESVPLLPLAAGRPRRASIDLPRKKGNRPFGREMRKKGGFRKLDRQRGERSVDSLLVARSTPIIARPRDPHLYSRLPQ
jgi:hypothetical protein